MGPGLYAALGDDKVENRRAQELYEARIIEKWGNLKNVERNKGVSVGVKGRGLWGMIKMVREGLKKFMRQESQKNGKTGDMLRGKKKVTPRDSLRKLKNIICNRNLNWNQNERKTKVKKYVHSWQDLNPDQNGHLRLLSSRNFAKFNASSSQIDYSCISQPILSNISKHPLSGQFSSEEKYVRSCDF